MYRSEQPALKRCPLCGSLAEIEYTIIDCAIQCTLCYLTLKRPAMMEGEAIEVWNMRDKHQTVHYGKSKDVERWIGGEVDKRDEIKFSLSGVPNILFNQSCEG